MSTATVSPNISHLPHTAHPIPLREHAFTLHCQGLRSPAIAAELGVSERTIRAWIAAALADLKDDLQLNRREQLLLAVERQHQLTAVAWQQFETEAAARHALLDATLQSLLAAAEASNPANASSTRSITIHLPASTPAPRYLSLILQANKEANRLLGLHTLARLQLLTSDLPDSPAVEPFPISDPDIPAESATASAAPAPSPAFGPSAPAPAFQGRDSSVPAKTATDPQSAQADFVAAGHPGANLFAGSPPAKTATAPDLSASSALNPQCSPFPFVSSALNPRPLPAKTATVSGSPLLVGEGLGVRSNGRHRFDIAGTRGLSSSSHAPPQER